VKEHNNPRKNKMKKTTRTMMAGAAITGLFAGAFVSQAHAALNSGVRSGSGGGATAINPGSMLGTLADSDTDKHDCKGKNGCKGKGGCQSGNNGCKGKNDCKGKGGCATNKT
jgi:hypothetical protein